MSKNFLDKLNFCIITFLAILEYQDATELDKSFNQNETDRLLEVGRERPFPGTFNSAVKTSASLPKSA